MSKLSKKDREKKRFDRKVKRENRRSDRREDKFSNAKTSNYWDFQLPKTISEKKGL